MQLSGEVTIAASAERVWEIVGHGFANIGEWATAIEASHQDIASAPQAGAPVAGRICETGLPGVPRVAETIVAYDEAERTLTYAATDVPRFIRAARNRWQVSPTGPDRARARFDGALELRGVVGLLVALPLRLRMRRETRTVLDDLKHYAEHGAPSPRKQRRVAGRTGELVAEPKRRLGQPVVLRRPSLPAEGSPARNRRRRFGLR